MIIYTYDPETKLVESYRKETADYQLQANETTKPIPDGIKNVRFIDNDWAGDPVTEDIGQQMIMRLSQQGVKQASQIKQLQQMFMVANQQQAVDRKGDSQQ